MTDEDMTDEDLGTQAQLRDALRQHAQPAEGAAARLLPAVRAGIESRPPRRTAWIGAIAAVLVAAGAIPAAVALLGGGGPDGGPEASPGSGPTATPPAVPVLADPPEGWRWESSLGLQAAVPADWAINDSGCNQTDRPSVVRGYGGENMCYTPEPSTKEIVSFQKFGSPPTLTEELVLANSLLDPATSRAPVVVDGVPAQRLTGQLPDGRYAEVLLFPDRGVALVARTLTEQTLATIVGSLRLVDVDHLGCPTPRPAITPSASGGATMVDPRPASIDVCYYGSGSAEQGWGTLLASGELTSGVAEQLAGLVNAAAPGANPDVPPDQCLAEPVQPDAVLLVHGSDGSVRRLWVSFSGCVDRGVTDGVDTVHVSQGIAGTLMSPLHIGYGLNGDLPN